MLDRLHTPPTARTVTQLLAVRRRIGAAVLLVGLVNLLSALTPPIADRAAALAHHLPLTATEGATVAVVSLGSVMVLLAAGLRRGLRRAWALAVLATVVNVAAHLVKGIDVEESLVAAAFAGVLLRYRADFAVRARLRHAGGPRLLGALAVAGLTGWASVRLQVPRPLGVLVAGLGVAALLAALWWYLRPQRAADDGTAQAVLGSSDDLAAARTCVDSSDDALAYFGLRADKERCWARASDGLGFVAYRVVDGACLVAPDPQGPPDAARRAWEQLQTRACEHGWPIAVIGASAAWLPRYRHAGMTCLYLGDVAVVDLDRFELGAPAAKSVRQAHRRVAKRGYRTAIATVAQLDDATRAAAQTLAAAEVAGGRERGFSMALGRIADPADPHALVCCTYAPDGRLVGFLQLVPAGPGRYSLDVMRAERAGHPNGLTDFALVELITWAQAAGYHELALNFAIRRGVVDGERGTQLERRLLAWISDRAQVHSLWHFNAKYSPRWEPRWVCMDPGFLPAILRSVVAAEQLWEVPVLGKLLARGADD